MITAETLLLVVGGVVGNAAVVWAVVRPELQTVRDEVRRAHDRLDGVTQANVRRVK